MNGAPLVCVEWRDILSCYEWEDVDKAMKAEPVLCKEVGWLIHDDVTKIIIAHCISDEPEKERQVNGFHVIPKGCVVRTTKLTQ